MGSPTSTYLISGSNQSARVGDVLSNALIMQVADADGDSVSGIQIEWSVTRGTGVIESSISTTDAQGCAAVTRFRVGNEVDRQEVRGSVPGLAPIFFAVTGTPGSSGGVQLASGNNQFATVGTAVSDPISFSVLNSQGQPWAGQTVSLQVISGNGVVEPAQAVSDSQGLVRLTRWTLGASAGVQVVRATLPGASTADVQATAVSVGAPALNRQVHVSNLRSPWDLAFSPSGAMFITERSGRLLVFRNGTLSTLATPTDVNPRTQSGLLGVAVDPDFVNNRMIYTFLSSNRSGAMDNRIRRWIVASDYSRAVEDRDIFTGISWGSDGGHSGGRIRFGPDGFLYITTGDTRSPTVPQDRRILGSKVLRITRNGDPAPGNPIWGANERREIFLTGLRNPQGLAFRPGGPGQGFICEHGPQTDDEITQLVPGGNGGWDPNNGSGAYLGYEGPDGSPMTDLAKFPAAIRPAYIVDSSAGMAGCDFLNGPQWGSWNGMLAVGLLAGQRILFVRLSANGFGIVGSIQTGFQGQARIRAVTQGPDGALYVITDASPNGEIWRVIGQ